jgi:hypothetical protein
MKTYYQRVPGMKGTKPILMGLAIAAAVMVPGWTLLAAGPAPVDLRSCNSFAILAATAVSTTGGGMINGDVGLFPAGSQGIPPAQVVGTIYNGGPTAQLAQADLTLAYNDAAGRSVNKITLTDGQNIGGLTLAPGLYWSATSLQITGDLTLDAGGDSSSVWIFQMGSTLTTAAGGAGDPHSRVILAGGARATNVFWKVGSSATLGTYSIFKGTIMAQASITMDTDSLMEGRALARAGAVTFNGVSGSLVPQDFTPISIAIPVGQSAYAGLVGGAITLDGSSSYDPDSDPITNYLWDVNGNGVFGDIGDISSTTATAVVSFPTLYVGVINLQVAAHGLTGTNRSPVGIFASSNDIGILSFSATNVIPYVSADVTVVMSNESSSIQDFTNVTVRFYNGSPLTNAAQIPGSYLVDLPRGIPVELKVSFTNLAGISSGHIYAFIDATQTIPEWNETNNIQRLAFLGRHMINDYDGDHRSDLGVYDPLTGRWYIETIDRALLAWDVWWGGQGGEPIPGDYDGDGRSDLMVCFTNGFLWYGYSLEKGQVITWANQWGWSETHAVRGDYDGDGRSDLAVYDRTRGNWYVKTLAGDLLAWGLNWGWNGAFTVVGDYNGDGAADLAVYGKAKGEWYVYSLKNEVLAWKVQWGWDGAIPVPGDYDGDGTFDLAVFDDNRGRWYISSLKRGTLAWNEAWGWKSAIRVPGDFDGDGTYDLTAFDDVQGLWYIWSLKKGTIIWGQQWGGTGDLPVGGRW